MDSWKLTSKFTAELGLRYAWNMTPSEAQDRYRALVPVAGIATSTIVPISEPYAQNNKNFQPRVGFAWNVFQNTVSAWRVWHAGGSADNRCSNWIDCEP